MLNRSKPMRRRPKPDKRDKAEKAYWDWLLDQPCVVTGVRGIERHHVRKSVYGAGMGLKPSDWFAIPISSEIHHRIHQLGSLTWERLNHPFEFYIEVMWNRYGLDRVPQEVKDKLIT